uniref:Uncharacterized protein n=1 Tax=Nelumbo nucifera TaxID=4432 RepID=A0A822XIR4_NELNU|nr:TPA_asm: hypothetical protein HUJ06_022867 [Nelumbo nucifera]
MENRHLIFAFNAITVLIIFLFILSYSTAVESSRPLTDPSLSTSFININGFTIRRQAYSGPSNRGRVH